MAVGILVVAALVAAGVAALRSGGAAAPPSYETAAVTRGGLLLTVTANGSLQSLTQVNVGTEISGVVDRVMVDYNSPVTRGQLLATINTDKLKAQADQSRAGLQAARARNAQALATVTEAYAQLARLQSVREMSGGRVPSQQEYDAQVAATARADADQMSAAAQVAQAEASLEAINTDLRKAEIRSPIGGIVLDRQVDSGQTVAASFQTPTLFTLAEDLTRMKLSIDVDEADIGQIRVGQNATFRVDAYPGRAFASVVSEIRSTPKTSNGVVTYQTILSVDNSDRLLRPGMTATADITVAEVKDALLVPNAALRFTPEASEPAASTPGGFSILPRPPASSRRTTTTTLPADSDHQRVWVLANGQPKEIAIATGLTDGRMTQVSSGPLALGDMVIVDVRQAE